MSALFIQTLSATLTFANLDAESVYWPQQPMDWPEYVIPFNPTERNYIERFMARNNIQGCYSAPQRG
jgi:hypothetical protein